MNKIALATNFSPVSEKATEIVLRFFKQHEKQLDIISVIEENKVYCSIEDNFAEQKLIHEEKVKAQLEDLNVGAKAKKQLLKTTDKITQKIASFVNNNKIDVLFLGTNNEGDITENISNIRYPRAYKVLNSLTKCLIVAVGRDRLILNRYEPTLICQLNEIIKDKFSHYQFHFLGDPITRRIHKMRSRSLTQV